MQVGDVNSSERGSGARFNGGKVRLDYVPARALAQIYTENRINTTNGERAVAVLTHIARFEEGGDQSDLVSAINAAAPGSSIERWASACRVFDFGATKYAAWNWAKGMAWSVPLACIKRHCVKILEGEKKDDESGHHHLGHIACNLIMLLHYTRNYREGDDRPPAECFARETKTIISPETGDSAEIDFELRPVYNEAGPELCAPQPQYRELPVPGPRSIPDEIEEAAAKIIKDEWGGTLCKRDENCSVCEKARETARLAAGRCNDPVCLCNRVSYGC